MSRLTIDVTEQQHQTLKALAALEGKTLRQYVLEMPLHELRKARGLSQQILADTASLRLDAHLACPYNQRTILSKGRAMRAAETNKPTRKPTNLSLDPALLQEAKALGVNVSRSAEAGIAEAVREHKRVQWLKDNASALASSNAYVEAEGLPLARHRKF